MTRKPRLAVTVGDPRGIGPEIVASLLRDGGGAADATLVVVGPSGAGVAVDENIGSWNAADGPAAAGRLAGAAIERAVRMALDGSVDGVVTAPIDKSVLPGGGYHYPGHTEMLAALTGSKVAMMLTAEAVAGELPGAAPAKSPAPAPATLRVVLATTHIPLREVPNALTRDRIIEVAGTTRAGLRDWFGIADPRLALCALNPHAGDHGRFGDEDDMLLAPAAREARLQGPFPADTVFVRAMRGEFDAVIAPYHDVGMTAIKVAAFGRGVNVTLGLPFPRCSPDHGTALDIAGRGLANPSSIIAATRMCAAIARRHAMAG